MSKSDKLIWRAINEAIEGAHPSTKELYEGDDSDPAVQSYSGLKESVEESLLNDGYDLNTVSYEVISDYVYDLF